MWNEDHAEASRTAGDCAEVHGPAEQRDGRGRRRTEQEYAEGEAPRCVRSPSGLHKRRRK